MRAFTRRGLCPNVIKYIVQRMKEGDDCSCCDAELHRFNVTINGNVVLAYFMSAYGEAYEQRISDGDAEHLIELGMTLHTYT